MFCQPFTIGNDDRNRHPRRWPLARSVSLVGIQARPLSVHTAAGAAAVQGAHPYVIEDARLKSGDRVAVRRSRNAGDQGPLFRN